MINWVHPDHLKAWHIGHDYRRIKKALRGEPVLLAGMFEAAGPAHRAREWTLLGGGRLRRRSILDISQVLATEPFRAALNYQ